jgi:hypothetical protein
VPRRVNFSEWPLPSRRFRHELVSRIHAECLKRGVTLEEFEDAVGWRLGQCMDPPERLLGDMTLDGLHWLCRELGIHWHRVILSL